MFKKQANKGGFDEKDKAEVKIQNIIDYRNLQKKGKR